MATSAATMVSSPTTPGTTALVTALRSRVVSTVARAMRSPGSLRSSAPTVIRSSRATSRCRAVSVIVSPVRSSR